MESSARNDVGDARPTGFYPGNPSELPLGFVEQAVDSVNVVVESGARRKIRRHVALQNLPLAALLCITPLLIHVEIAAVGVGLVDRKRVVDSNGTWSA